MLIWLLVLLLLITLIYVFYRFVFSKKEIDTKVYEEHCTFKI